MFIEDRFAFLLKQKSEYFATSNFIEQITI